jgi:hypothetical protein
MSLAPDIISEDALAHPEGGTHMQDDYVVVRNFLLTKWRVDPYRVLLAEDAMGSIQRRHLPVVQAAHRFLERHGYINFGVAPALRYVSPESTTSPEASTSLPSVRVIGAGLAGPSRERSLLLISSLQRWMGASASRD